MTSRAPRASARHQLGAAPNLCRLLELLAVSFPHNICLLPLEDPGREGGRLGNIHRLCGLHWEEVGCRGEGGGTGCTAVTPEGTHTRGQCDTLRPATPGHTLAQPSTHHMFLLECHDTSLCLLHVGPRTPQASAGTGLPSWPLQPLQADTKEWDLAPCPLTSPPSAQDAGGSSLER